MAADWNAIGALAGIAGASLMIGGATVTAVRSRLTKTRNVGKRLDILEIRLFGLPADAETGASRVDGQFDRIDHRFDAVLREIRKNGNGTH